MISISVQNKYFGKFNFAWENCVFNDSPFNLKDTSLVIYFN